MYVLFTYPLILRGVCFTFLDIVFCAYMNGYLHFVSYTGNIETLKKKREVFFISGNR